MTYGNSGSPVINRGGEVVGVCVMGMKLSHDGLFIPSSTVIKFLEQNKIKVDYRTR